MIEIIFLALLAGILILQLIRTLGQKRDDDPVPPASLLELTKKSGRTTPEQIPLTEAGAVEVVVEKPMGFFVPLRMEATDLHAPLQEAGKPLDKKLGKFPLKKMGEKKEENSAQKTTIIEDSQDPRWHKAWAGIVAIKSHDPDFVAEDFLKAAEDAFTVIIDTYVKGEGQGEKPGPNKSAAEILKAYIKPPLLNDFITTLKEREKSGYYQEPKTLIGINRIKMLDAAVDNEGAKKFQIKLQIESDQIYALYDKDDVLVEGDDSRIIPKKDIWIFDRSDKDPRRWFLSAIES